MSKKQNKFSTEFKITAEKMNTPTDKNVSTRTNITPSDINILVVDDEEMMRSFLHDALSDIGYNVQIASTGEEALKKIQQAYFEIVLTELRLPGMSGIEVIKKFKEIRSDICIIVITAYPSVETAVEAMRNGAYDYVTKPLNLDELRIIIARAAEKQVLQRAKDVYEELSITDGLTNIFNHRYFQEMLPREVHRASRYSHHLSLIMIDIDDFKIYNDRNGHIAGDNLLKQLAQLLVKSIRKVDFVFRYGGEEFAILLPETGKEGASVVARCLRSKVEQRSFQNEDVLPKGRLTISVGVAVYPDDARAVKELVTKADQALYQAKNLGKNRACFFGVDQIKTVNEEEKIAQD